MKLPNHTPTRERLLRQSAHTPLSHRAARAHPRTREELPQVHPAAGWVPDAGTAALFVEGVAGSVGVVAALVVLDEHGAVGEEAPGEPRLVVAYERAEPHVVVVARGVDEEHPIQGFVQVEPRAQGLACGGKEGMRKGRVGCACLRSNLGSRRGF